MLSERERRTLAGIERRLVDSDPELAQLFSAAAPGSDGPTPAFLLVVLGLALLVLGSIVVAIPVAVVGMALAISALLVAGLRPTGAGRASA